MNLDLIHADQRGLIHSLTGIENIPEVAILKTEAGYARGGCIHSVVEYLCVLEGEIIFRYRPTHLKTIIEEKKMRKGDTIVILPNVPHYFVSEIESVVIEWGVDPKDKQVKHKEFRDIVEEHNKNI